MFLVNSSNPSSSVMKSFFYNLPFVNQMEKTSQFDSSLDRNTIANQYLYSEELKQYDPYIDTPSTSPNYLNFNDFISDSNFRLQILKCLFVSSVSPDTEVYPINNHFGNKKPNIKNVFGNHPGSFDSLIWDSMTKIPNRTWKMKNALITNLSLFSYPKDFHSSQNDPTFNNGTKDLSEEDIRNLFYLFLLKANPEFLKNKFNIEESWFDQNLDGIKESKVYVQKLAFERKFNINYFLLKENASYIKHLTNCSDEEKEVIQQYKDAFFEKEVVALQRVIAFFAFLTQERMRNFFYQQETKTNFYNSCMDDSFFKASSSYSLANEFIVNSKYFKIDSDNQQIVSVNYHPETKDFQLQRSIITNHILNVKNRVEHNGKVYYTNLPATLVSSFNIIPSLNLPNFNFESDIKMNEIFSKTGGATISNTNRMTLGRLADISFMDYKELEDLKYYIPKEDFQADDYTSSLNSFNRETTSDILKQKVRDQEAKQVLTMKSIIDASFQAYGNNQIKCISIDKFFASAEDDFTFYLNDLTFKKITTKAGTFVPVSVTLKVKSSHSLFSASQTEEEINYLFLLTLNCNTSKVSSYIRAQKSLIKLTEYITYKDALYFFNKEKYLEDISKIFGDLNKFSNLFTDYLYEKFPSLFNNYSEYSNPQIPKPVERKAFRTLTSKPKIESNLEEKFLKLKTQEKTIKEHLEKAQKDAQTFEDEKNYYQREFENHTRIANQNLENFNNYKNKLEEALVSKNSFTETYQNFLSTFSKVESEYVKSFNESISSQNLEEDSFYTNLESDGIYISSIKLAGTKNIISLDFNTNNFDNNDIQDLINKKYKIESLEIVFSKPVKIKIDSSPTNFVYGGPYKVFVSSNSMQINALNKSTVFGIDKSNKKIILHPHANQTIIYRNDTIQSLCFSQRNCCLGEASPYIYNAFKENNLKMILVNVMIWVTSANSSDTWGRNYKFLPKTIKEISETKKIEEKSTEEVIEELQVSEVAQECNHDYLEGVCTECEHQCLHTDIDAQGICLDCAIYLSWADRTDINYTDEDDEDECDDHEYNDAGFCIHCGYYNEEYDLAFSDQTQENTTQTPPVYTPYVQLTNTNNNQG